MIFYPKELRNSEQRNKSMIILIPLTDLYFGLLIISLRCLDVYVADAAFFQFVTLIGKQVGMPAVTMD
jgi:hypothetical protein